MKPFFIIFFTGLAFFLFPGCERDIDLPLRLAQDALVVDASIENGRPPVVVLSSSFNYFSKITPALLASSFVHGARIVVQSGTDSVVLKEYAYPVGNTAIYFYSTDTASGSTPWLGQLNKRYNLRIIANGKTYLAQTTIPGSNKRVDSLWVQRAPNNSDTLKRIMFARIYDPPGLGNYIRYYTSINDSAFLPGLNSVYDDDVTDGTNYNIQVFKGADRNYEIDPDEYGYFYKGDTVRVKLCNIDRATFEFWRTLEYAQGAVGNPFSQPGVVLGNISNGALGYFGGYAAQYRTIIIRE